MKTTDILPLNVEIKYDYLKIDNVYVSVLAIVDYGDNVKMFECINQLSKLNEIEVNFHIKRENNYDLLKKLTNIISENTAEKSSVSKNQIDINILENIKNKAIELRRKIQIDNVQIYSISTYIVIKADNEKELLVKQKKYINMLYAKQIISKPSNFRQKEAYLATLPILVNNTQISKYTHNVFTEKALAKMFPFFKNDILDMDGIILGRANKNLCSINMFSQNNNNYNMCVFGSSGAGKSYFIKLMIIRNAYKGIRQIIVDPEGEYVNLVNSLGGHVYDIESLNPFEINEAALQNVDFFEMKIKHVEQYLLEHTNIRNENIKEYIIKTYNEFGISNNKDSLYIQSSNTDVYIKPKYIQEFPTIEDLKVAIENKQSKTNCREKQTFSHVTKNTELYCINLKGRDLKEIHKEMKIFIPKVYELIQTNTLIYFDEIWKIIGFGADIQTVQSIYDMFKTLRKKKAGIIAISQDVCDLFSFDKGSFGKSILNNSNMKCLFKMEWQDLEILEKILNKRDVLDEVKKLMRGNALVSMGNTNFSLQVEATKYEHELIEGEDYEKNFGSNAK